MCLLFMNNYLPKSNQKNPQDWHRINPSRGDATAGVFNIIYGIVYWSLVLRTRRTVCPSILLNTLVAPLGEFTAWLVKYNE